MDAGDGACLPYDVLLDILRRLPCRAAAQSRTICRAWRALVDDHGLLPRFFSSRSCFPGVFTNHTGCQDRSYFLAPPASRAPSDAADDFRRPLFWHGWARVGDHCNGLLLLHDDRIRFYGEDQEGDAYVCNPATIRCDRLPRSRPPPLSVYTGEGTFLAFDPAVSLHYEVYWVLSYDKTFWSRILGCSDHEPGTTVVHARVFSSQTRRWTMRQFVPGRCAPEHLHAVNKASGSPRGMSHRPRAEYWRGSLYFVGQNGGGVLTILRCLEGTYDLLQLPGKVYTSNSEGATRHLPRRSLLASYDKGVHYAELNAFRLRVWALGDEGQHQLGWTLVHDANLEPHLLGIMEINSPTTPRPTRSQWEMIRNKKSNSLFRRQNDTTHGVDDEQVDDEEEQHIDVDGLDS